MVVGVEQALVAVAAAVVVGSVVEEVEECMSLPS